MTWAKGQSGNPHGAKIKKIISDQIKLVLGEEEDVDGSKIKKLRLLAEKLVDQALTGDIQAIREVIDRVEGKAVQRFEGEVDHNHHAADLSDDELASIIRSSSGRASKKANGQKKPDTVH